MRTPINPAAAGIAMDATHRAIPVDCCQEIDKFMVLRPTHQATVSYHQRCAAAGKPINAFAEPTVSGCADGSRKLGASTDVGHGWPAAKRRTRRCMTPRSAADRASKARMFDYMEVGVRAGARSASIAGKFQRHDVAEAGMPSAMVLATFAETKVARSPRRRAEPRHERRLTRARSRSKWIPGSTLRVAPE